MSSEGLHIDFKYNYLIVYAWTKYEVNLFVNAKRLFFSNSSDAYGKLGC